MNRLERVLLIALGCMSLVGLSVSPATAAPSWASHPIQVRIDGEFAPARSAWLRFEAEQLDLDLPTLRRGASHPVDVAFVALVDAIRAGDLEKVRRGLDLSGSRMGVAEVITHLRDSFADFGPIQVVLRAQAEGRQVVYFRVKGRTYTGGFAFRLVEGAWVAELVTGEMSVASLIADGLDGRARDPSAFAPVAQTPAAHRLPLDEEGSVFLEVSVQRHDLDPQDELLQSNGPWADAWIQGMRTLAAADWQAFAALHTPKSQEKIAQWLTGPGATAEGRQQASGVLTQEARLRAVIEVAPSAALVLYTQGEKSGPAETVVRATWLVRGADGVRWTNHFKAYALDLTMMRSPVWPKTAPALEAYLNAIVKKGAQR